MARSHGKILVDIWLDPDWLDLDPLAQWTFIMLLSQPKLTMVGSIDYEPNRWASNASLLSEQDVEDAVARLEAAGFVCVDHASRELLIRSMTRHDGLRANNPKLLKGLWGQWKGIASAGLRKVCVDNMPGALFDDPQVTPKSADALRAQPVLDWRIEHGIAQPNEQPNDSSNGWPIDQSIVRSNARTARLPPSTTRRPTPTDAQSADQSPLRPPARDPDEARRQLEAIQATRASVGSPLPQENTA